jgi:hypothetical protein
MAVMVGADGMKYTQREENDKTYKTETKVHNDYSSKKDTTFTQSSSSSSSQQQQQQLEQQVKQDDQSKEHILHIR